MAARTLISEFDLDNPIYAQALVTAYAVTGGGAKDTTLVTLYPAESGAVTLQNPQVLTSRGQWKQPVYTDEPCIIEIVGPHVASHDTGIIRPDTASATTVLATGSTDARTSADWFGDIPNVKAFGAVGDYDPATQTGTNDQTAFDAAVAASANNSIYAPDADFLITTYPGALVQILGPGRLWLSGNKRAVGNIWHVGVAEGSQNDSVGGINIGGGGGSGHGVLIKPGGGNWLTKIQPSRIGSAMQWQTYTRGYVGLATSVISTGFIDIDTGVSDLTDTGDNIEIGDLMAFDSIEYRVKTIPSSSRLELETPAGGAVSFAASAQAMWAHCFVYEDGTCDTNGLAVAWKSGDRFGALLDSTEAKIKINGVDYAIDTLTDDENLVLLATAGVQSGVTFRKKVISGERRTVVMNLQNMRGANEENFTISIDIFGRLNFKTGAAGLGQNRPMTFKSGINPDDSSRDHLTIHENGQVLIGLKEPSLTPSINRAKLEAHRPYTTAATGGGSLAVRLFRASADFAGTGYRAIDLGFYNDNLGGFFKSPQDQTIQFQDGGGKSLFGAKGTATFVLEVEGDFGPHADASHAIGSAGLQFTNANLSAGVNVAGNAVVGARKTGWALATGTPTRTTFVTSSVTLPQLAERVKALIDDLHATAGHGLIGT